MNFDGETNDIGRAQVRIKRAMAGLKFLSGRQTCLMMPELAKAIVEAVTLQGRVNDSAPNTDGRGDCVFSRDSQINAAVADGKGVPAFQVQQVGQANTVTKPDFSVPVTGGLYGYC